MFLHCIPIFVTWTLPVYYHFFLKKVLQILKVYPITVSFQVCKVCYLWKNLHVQILKSSVHVHNLIQFSLYLSLKQSICCPPFTVGLYFLQLSKLGDTVKCIILMEKDPRKFCGNDVKHLDRVPNDRQEESQLLRQPVQKHVCIVQRYIG